MKFSIDHTRQCLQTASPVTPMLNRAEKPFFQTILTNMPVTVKSGARTQQPEIVNGLHHRHMAGNRRIIHRRADQIQRVMNVDNIYPPFPDNPLHFLVGSPIKNSRKWQHQLLPPGEFFQLQIAPGVQDDFMAMLFQHLLFVGDHCILAAWNLVIIVHNQHVWLISVTSQFIFPSVQLPK